MFSFLIYVDTYSDFVQIQECLADNAICILSLSDGTIAVFDFSSRKIVKDLDCTSLAGRDHQLSLTDELIVAVSNDGDIFMRGGCFC